jgi:hypothetical protein
MLHCLRSCADQSDDDDEEEHDVSYDPPETIQMDHDDDGGSHQCCRPYASDEDQPPFPAAWAQFWNKLRKENYQHLSDGQDGSLVVDQQAIEKFIRKTNEQTNSPLRTAASFDSSCRDVLTIKMEEIVLPGSALQQEMAKFMSQSLRGDSPHEDECVICMEGFSESNPRMPTVCGCGENRTFFHLPCLYQWVEQSTDCPSCRQKITWEEF